MKRFTKFLILILSVIMLVAVFPACSIFDDNEQEGDDTKAEQQVKTQSIVVYNDNTPMEYTATYGEILEIEIVHKKGYYFLGAYDEKEGGTKYFDIKGNSTVVWGAGMPDTYYIRHEDISNIAFDSGLKFYEEPQKTNANTDAKVIFEFDDALINAIKANLDAKLKIEIALEAKCNKGWELYKVYVQNLKNGGESVILGQRIKLSSETYKSLAFSTTMDADLFQKGYLYIYLDVKDGIDILDTPYYYKNMSVKITFDK